MAPSSTDLQKLKERYVEAGQDHVFRFYDELNPSEQDSLFEELNQLDVERVNRIYQKAISVSDSSSDVTQHKIEPLPEQSVGSLLSNNKDQVKKWEDLGLDCIAQGKVAVILMAGGQGTRLGSALPKGCYDIGLPSHKSLFQLQAERILRLQNLANEIAKKDNVVIPWYIMTSGPTRNETEKHFKAHNYFGLKEKDVIFFDQGTLPCLTNDGKIFLEQKSKLAVAPDGNGGIYAALRNKGVLQSLTERKIEYIHSYCVDNCLVKVADPVFIGYSVSKEAECGAKVVRKTIPDEPVGVLCLKDGLFNVVEYSEIDPKVAAQTLDDIDDNGRPLLMFRAANIANHFYTLKFLERIHSFEDQLEYHIARKKIKHVDLESGEVVAPAKPNGLKLELFVFDVFPFTKQLSVLEVDRKEEFSPLKNAPGSGVDCPETSRHDIIAQQIRFVQKAGGKIESDNVDPSTIEFEISPLVSYSGEGLEVVKDKNIRTPVIIESQDDLLAHLIGNVQV